MSNCEICGQELTGSFVYCPTCGAHLASIKSDAHPSNDSQDAVEVITHPEATKSERYEVELHSDFGQAKVESHNEYRQAKVEQYSTQSQTEVEQHPIPPQAEVEQHPVPPQAEVELYTSRRHAEAPKTIGIGGWLGAFVFIAVISLLFNAYTVLSVMIQISNYWGYFPQEHFNALVMEFASSSVLVIAVVLQLYFVIGVLRRRSYFMRAVQHSFVALFISAIVLLAANVTVGLNTLPAESLFALSFNIIASVLGFVIYTLYFSKSTRVRMYIGNNAYQNRAMVLFTEKGEAGTA